MTVRGRIDPRLASSSVRVLLDVSAVPREPRGAGYYILELARSLARHDDRGFSLVLLCRKNDGRRWQELVPEPREGEPPKVIVRSAAPGLRPTRLVWEQTVGPRIVDLGTLDVWHGPHYTIPLRTHVPRVVTVHDLTMLEHPDWHERAKAFYFGRMIPAAVSRAAVCVCVSRHTADRLTEVLPVAPGQPPRDVVVIPHGVDHVRFHPERDAARDLARLDALGVRVPYVAFVGTIEPRKDVPSLVRAFARIAAEQPDLQLVLAGGRGWDDGAVDAAIEASGVARRIVRTGYLDDDAVPALMRRARAVVYPSFEEGFGLPALEALACGAPLVTTSGSSIEEVVGDAALLVPPGDDAALADALRGTFDPDVARVLAAAGPLRAAGYSWEAAADAHLAVYRRAAGAAARR